MYDINALNFIQTHLDKRRKHDKPGVHARYFPWEFVHVWRQKGRGWQRGRGRGREKERERERRGRVVMTSLLTPKRYMATIALCVPGCYQPSRHREVLV